MKRFLTSVLAIALIAGPLAATSADAQTGRHNLKKPAAAARAQVSPRAPVAQAESTAVYEWGKYQGQDPDPNVRLMLRRDVHN